SRKSPPPPCRRSGPSGWSTDRRRSGGRPFFSGGGDQPAISYTCGLQPPPDRPRICNSVRHTRAAAKRGEAMARKATVSTAKRPQAQSVCIGIIAVSAAHDEDWTGPLAACEFDAHDMAAIARDRGMNSTLLLTRKATRAGVLGALRKSDEAL